MDEALPSYAEQRPYILSFRKFIADPKNKNAKGLSWTPAVLLEELWRLHSPAENEFYADFCDRYYQSMERYRKETPQSRTNDPLLFALIKKFLETHEVWVPQPNYVTAIRHTVSNAWAFLAPASLMPVFSDTVDLTEAATLEERLSVQEGVRVYTIWQRGGGEGLTPFFLALRIARKMTTCCPCMAFSLSSLELHTGLYFFSTRECYVRDVHGSISYRFSFANSDVEDKDISMDTLDRATAGYGSLSQGNWVGKRVKNPRALAFSESYFKHFDK